MVEKNDVYAFRRIMHFIVNYSSIDLPCRQASSTASEDINIVLLTLRLKGSNKVNDHGPAITKLSRVSMKIGVFIPSALVQWRPWLK